MSNFQPQNIGLPLDEVISDSESAIDFSTAQDECTDAVEELTADVSGIGPKAAERYLLRHEYGYTTKSLAEQYGVTPPAITKQTQTVRRKVHRYPTLAKIVGRFRASRANLSEPLIDQAPLWQGQLDTGSVTVDAQVGFYPGSFSVPYSWMFSLGAESKDGDTIRHLHVDYIIKAECGVLLKRSLKGISHTSWQRTPYYQSERKYTVFPLPNPRIPHKDGTLIDAVEHHVTYDTTKTFEEYDWQTLEMYAKSNTGIERPSAGLSNPAVLLDRVRRENTIDSVFDYSEEVHVRDNLEQILTLYPLTPVTQLPLDTVKLLWNGSLTRHGSEESTVEDLRAALETSRITFEPGQRTT